MLIAACGMACGECKLLENEACEARGCCSGIDERVAEVQKLIKADFGFVCKVLECAAKRKQEFCFNCKDFPCEPYYTQGELGQGFPYSRQWLDRIKSEKDTPF